MTILDSFYAQYRVQSGAVPRLRDDMDSPPERLLQAIWQHQRLLRERLQTLDGRPVRVLHPGFHNLEGGPDFRSAVVQLGDDSPKTGDVEVDLRANGWHVHGHDRNPAFANVLLHVIWEGENLVAGAPPLMLLRPVLDAPLGELSLWLGGEAAQGFPEELRGRCCAPLRRLSNPKLVDLLHQAAAVRLRSKGAQFQARARQVGWEQSLWEGLFRALGYKHNVWPMQRLAELRAVWNHAPGEFDTRQLLLQARLLGLSGLLPAELPRGSSGTNSYLRQVWDQWWREQDALADKILPRAVWRLHGIRPANHPHRRLALAAAWSDGASLAGKIQAWCSRELADAHLAASLLETLEVEQDPFWSWHWTLQSAAFKNPMPLLGETRLTDIAINVVLPWLWIRVAEGKNEKMQQQIEHRYFTWPAAQDNSVLRLARQRLLGGASPRLLPGAAAQQGLLQLVRDFCDHSNSVCDACKLPPLVAEFSKAEFSSALAERQAVAPL